MSLTNFDSKCLIFTHTEKLALNSVILCNQIQQMETSKQLSLLLKINQ